MQYSTAADVGGEYSLIHACGRAGQLGVANLLTLAFAYILLLRQVMFVDASSGLIYMRLQCAHI